jgi:hypothetical protein
MHAWPPFSNGADDRALDGVAEVGVGEHDVGVLAAELERDRLDRLRRRRHDTAADLGRAGERDLVDERVGDERGARRPVAGDDVEHAGGQPGLERQGGEPQRAQRRLLGRLEDDGVAGRERGPELPRRHEQRVVPRHDLTADADGLAGRVGEERAVGRVDRAVQLRRPARVVPQDRRGPADVPAGLEDRLAVVARLERAELLGVLVDQVREAVQAPRPGRSARGRSSARRRTRSARRARPRRPCRGR